MKDRKMTRYLVIDECLSEAIELALRVISRRAGYHAVDRLNALRHLGWFEPPCHHVSDTLSVILTDSSPNQATCSTQGVFLQYSMTPEKYLLKVPWSQVLPPTKS